jgi:DNA invertase Pin-like site-specific DNA recombinase
MIIGYARVSTNDQNLDLQIECIEKYAKEKGEQSEIYSEKESGGKADRKELANAIKAAQEGNTFVVYKLDRLARSTKQLYEVTGQLEKKGVQFVSLNDKIDTTTAVGKAMFGMLAVFAEFERSIIQERTKAGLESARKRGNTGGRPPLKEGQKQQIKKLFESGERAADIAKEYGIARSTVYKVMKEFEGVE